MSNRILSIDIRKQGVFALLVRTALKGNRIEAFKNVSFLNAPANATSPGDQLAWALGVIVDEIPAVGAGCLVSIAPAEVSFRNLQVPFKDSKKIRQVLSFELEPTLPYEIDSLQVDFLPVRQVDQTDLIVAVVENQKLEALQEILGRYDLTPRVITIGAAATALCIARNSRAGHQNFLLLDMDGSNVTACIVMDRRLYMIRTLRTGANAAPTDSAKAVSDGVYRMLAAFETLYDTDAEIDRVLLSGVNQPDAIFVETLSRSLEIEVNPINLAADTRLYVQTSQDLGVGPEANGAASLASIETAGIRPFQFNQSHPVLQKYWMENRTEMISAGILAVFVFLLLMTQVILENQRLQEQIARADRQMNAIFKETFPEETRIVDPLQQMQAGIARIREQNVYARQDGSDIRNVDVLKAISELIPERVSVVMTRFVRGDNSVQIAGLTDTFNGVDDIKMQLEKSQYFSQITISSANMDKGLNRVRFRIKMDLAQTLP